MHQIGLFLLQVFQKLEVQQNIAGKKYYLIFLDLGE